MAFLSAQVVDAERSVTGWIAAAVPALGFLVMVKIALGRAAAGLPMASDSEPSLPDVTATRRTVVAQDARVPERIGGSEDHPAPAVARQTGAVVWHDDGPASVPPVPDTEPRSGTVRTGGPDRSADPPQAGPFDPAQVTDVVHVLGAPAAARDALVDQGRPPTRKALTEQLRRNGHALSNARASLLVKISRQR
ncbi:hypothetical protein WEI85_09155 [Actinomycetes bacterium KLBMP 9797]